MAVALPPGCTFVWMLTFMPAPMKRPGSTRRYTVSFSGILYDTRDNSINADHGVMANAVYRTYFNGLLGGDSAWQSLNIDLRTFSRSRKTPVRNWRSGSSATWVTGGTAPYFDLPKISFDGRPARGYSEGRYRGEHLLYGEVEYRGALLNKRSRTNFYTDWGWGKDGSRGFYLGIQEAF